MEFILQGMPRKPQTCTWACLVRIASFNAMLMFPLVWERVCNKHGMLGWSKHNLELIFVSYKYYPLLFAAKSY